jgi:hypothetical protein
LQCLPLGIGEIGVVFGDFHRSDLAPRKMVGICKPTLSMLDPCFSVFFPAFRHLDIIQTGS